MYLKVNLKINFALSLSPHRIAGGRHIGSKSLKMSEVYTPFHISFMDLNEIGNMKYEKTKRPILLVEQ